MKKESKQDRTYAQAIALIEELAIRAYARAHGVSLSTAQAFVDRLQHSDAPEDEAAYAAVLNGGEASLAGALGLAPNVLRAWLDDADMIVFPTLKSLGSIRQALAA